MTSNKSLIRRWNLRITCKKRVFPPRYRRVWRGSEVRIRNLTRGSEFTARHDFSPRQVEVLLAGGRLNYVKSSQA